ncbi:hypothetical protein FHS29_005198 [Saccharothrix tamanrassetensis]|uniref:Uncharacterized protein n=1 Tax=Saccharothrix tamanrassetensis TaxID=1051531 RepID=A0A841CN77_9PSEU|nr:hypothetical protein [Saccharothrix tamanrassetensis]MBB5958590.1 hypothetical protein [Saccharothrix tamanrassetensis]
MSRADLPQPGTESELRCRASGVEFTLRSRPVLVDFTGTCVLKAEADADSPEPVRLRLSGLRLVADLPDAGGPEDGGTVTLEQDGAEGDGAKGDGAEGDGVLRPLPDSPSRFANDLVVTLKATVDQPDGVVHAVARNAVKFSTARASYPSGSGDYELSDAIDLIMPDAPEVTVAQINSLRLRLDPA